MDLKKDILNEEGAEVITPRFVLEMLLPIIKDEFIAKCRADRAGIKLTFTNGQKFHITVNELK